MDGNQLFFDQEFQLIDIPWLIFHGGDLFF
jgi:hypothetical protein